MSGMIATRIELRDLLNRARRKRQHMLSDQLMLLGIERSLQNQRYSDSLQKLVSSSTLGLTHPSSNPTHFNPEGLSDVSLAPSVVESGIEVPDMDIDSEMEIEPAPSEAIVVDTEREVSVSQQVTKDYTKFVSDLKAELETSLMEKGEREVSWDAYTARNKRSEGASNFFHLLIAASEREIAVQQEVPFGDIRISQYI